MIGFNYPRSLPALLGGKGTITQKIPPWPPLDPGYNKALEKVLHSRQWWSLGGTEVKRFEQHFAQLHQAQSAIACTNGTHALELALRTLNIGPGDEVIVPSLTFVATSMAVMLVGATPVVVDVEADHWCLDPIALKAALTPKTRAIIPVHFAGHICDMAVLLDIAHQHQIAIIEDAAHAHGAIRAGQYAGSFGQFAAFSFQNFKLMTAGEGGILLSNDPKLTQRARLIANCGRPEGDTRYQHLLPCTNMRLSEFQGAILNLQCDQMEERANLRAANGKLLMAGLSEIPGIRVQKSHPDMERHSNYMIVFTCETDAFGGLSRDQIVECLTAENLPAFRMYPRLQDTAHFSHEESSPSRKACPCPVSLKLADHGIWLHHRILLADERLIFEIIETLKMIAHHGRVLKKALSENNSRG